MVSSKSQINTRSGALPASAGVSPLSEAMLRVGLGWACRRPRVRPVLVVGVVFVADILLVFGDIDKGEIGECECARSVDVVDRPSEGLSDKPVGIW